MKSFNLFKHNQNVVKTMFKLRSGSLSVSYSDLSLEQLGGIFEVHSEWSIALPISQEYETDTFFLNQINIGSNYKYDIIFNEWYR